MRQQRAQRRRAHFVGKLRRDRALNDRVALLFHLANARREALAFRAMRKIGILDRSPTHVIVKQQQHLVGGFVL